MSVFDWPINEYSVQTLRLDRKNPRIFLKNRSTISQNDLINILYKQEDVLEIIKSILKKGGYFTHENLIGLKENEKIVVIEGNRRLAALKILNNIEILDEKYRIAVKRALNGSNLDLNDIPKKIKVAIAKNRRNAMPALVERHATKAGQKRWERTQQARYIRSLITEEGLTISDISNEQGYTESEIEGFLKAEEIYSLANSLELKEKTREYVEDIKKFPLTNIERFLGFPDVRNFFNINYTSDGIIEVKSSKNEFIIAFTKLLDLMSQNKLTSRTINTGADAQEFLKENLEGVKPTPKQRKIFSSRDIIFDQREKTGIKNEREKSEETTKRIYKSQSIIPVGVKTSCSNQRIQKIFKELKSTPIKAKPNTTAVLFRILLDLCISNFVINSKATKEIREHYDKKGKKGKDWHPTLRQQINYILNNQERFNIEIEGQQLSAVLKFVDSGNRSFSLDEMDKFIHNIYVDPTKEVLESLWIGIEPLLNIILHDPILKK